MPTRVMVKYDIRCGLFANISFKCKNMEAKVGWSYLQVLSCSLQKVTPLLMYCEGVCWCFYKDECLPGHQNIGVVKFLIHI